MIAKNFLRFDDKGNLIFIGGICKAKDMKRRK